MGLGRLQWRAMQTASDRGASTWLRPEFTRLLAILWVVGLTLIYFVRYEGWIVLPQLAGIIGASMTGLRVGPYFREFWTARVYDFGCVVAIVAASLGLGATVAGRRIARRDVLGMLFALGVGLWLLSVLVLVTGALAVAKVPYTFLTLACWLLPAPRRFVGDFHVSTERTDSWAKLMLACILLAAALNLVGALAPPFEYDELEYHLGALADYQRAGRVVFLPHNFYSNMPQLTEMLYLLAKTTTSDIAAKLLHWLFGLLAAATVYGVAQRLWSKAAGLTAAALFYCTPFLQDLGQTARIDLATAFFATLAFGALVLWMEEEEKRDLLWLSALGVGGAAATKWPAIAVVLLPAAAGVIFRRKYRLLAGFCSGGGRHGRAVAGKELASDRQPGVSAIVSIVPEPALDRRTGAGILGETRTDVWICNHWRVLCTAVEIFARRGRSGPTVVADNAPAALGSACGTSGKTGRMVVRGLVRRMVLFHVSTVAVLVSGIWHGSSRRRLCHGETG